MLLRSVNNNLFGTALILLLAAASLAHPFDAFGALPVHDPSLIASGHAELYLPTNFADPDAGVQPPKVKPRSFSIPSADSTLVARRLRWHHWGSGRTFARGQARWCEDVSDCGEAWRSYKIVASKINTSLACPGRWYTRVKGKMAGEVWSEMPLGVC